MAQCRFCEAPLNHLLIDLGMSPLCESYVPADKLNSMEPFYPLHVYVCEHCFLVQLEEYVAPKDIFSEYAYFSSYSTSWRQHAKAYTDKMRRELRLDERSLVVEIGSNDGYLLEYFVQAGVPVLGVEPAANVAETADRPPQAPARHRPGGCHAALESHVAWLPADPARSHRRPRPLRGERAGHAVAPPSPRRPALPAGHRRPARFRLRWYSDLRQPFCASSAFSGKRRNDAAT